MFADYLNRFLAQRGIHYGWVMGIIAFIMTVCSSAVSSVPQIIILPITSEFGWQISDVSNAIGVMFVVLGCCAPFAGALMLKIGLRNVGILAMGLSVSGLFLTMLAFREWHLLVTIGVFFGAAAGIIGLGLAATVATRWFVARRGLVVGVLASAFAAGQLLFVPVMAWITTVADWRVALLIPIGSGILSAILFLLFSRNWPSDLGLPPFGEKEIFLPPENQEMNIFSTSFQVLFDALKHPAFWILSATFMICGLSSTGIVGQHFIPFCADNNVGIVAASSFLAVMGVFNFLGTIGSGWLSDRFDNFKLLMWYYGLRALSLFYLPFSGFEFYTLILWAVFFGLDYISTVPPTVKLTGRYFGQVKGPILFGWIFAVHQFGSAIAASSAGWSRDTLLSYVPAFIAAGIFSGLAVLLIILFKFLDMRAGGLRPQG
jgi:predicted MFS family arabinose efflux permease